MKSLYEVYIKPDKEHYYLIGAIIAMIGILKIVFEDHIALDFLIGISLFFLSMIFFSLILRMEKKSLKDNKNFTFWTLFYEILFIIFIITFFVASYSKYPLPFGIFIALFLVFVLHRILAFLRGYFVIFQKRFKKRITKIIFRIIFLIVLIFLFWLINTFIISRFDIYNFGTKLESKETFSLISADEWSWYVFMMSNSFFFFILCLMSFIDVFKKEPTGYKNLVWKNSKLYQLINKIKKRKMKTKLKNFYINYIE
jgi:hypothetical protein